MSKSAPKAPDYEAAADKQAEGSRQVTEAATWANRPDQFTPFGRQTWDRTAEWDPTTKQSVNRWAQTTTLDPDAQRALDAQLSLTAGRSELGASMMNRAENEFGTEMDWDKFRAGGGDVAARNLDPSSKYYQDASDAIYGQWADRALPQQAKDTDAMRTQLYNMGVFEGDPGYDEEMRKLRETQGDQQSQAAYRATIGAGGEAQRMLGMDAQAGGQNFQQEMAASELATRQRQQQIAEEGQRRGYSLNEINALISGQQVAMPDMPGFNTAGTAQGPQNLQAAQMTGQSNLDAFNAQNAGIQGMMSGLGSMGMGYAGIMGKLG